MLVDVEEVEEQGEAVVDAVEEVIGRGGYWGVSFGLTDEGCARATAEARREALPAAQAVADDLSLALAMGRGEVVSVLEYPLGGPYSFGYYLSNEVCASGEGYGC